MGDSLAKPVTEKHSSLLENDHLRVGATGMQGWRKGMEDAHCVCLDISGSGGGSLFGVFDGHCGPETAQFCGRRLQHIVAHSEDYARGNWKRALEQSFLGLDEEVAQDGKVRRSNSGSTAVTCLLTPDLKLVCGNAGDSRCVLSRGGQPHPLSFDHKPTQDGELQRIQAAGAFVASGRVNGNLALSRAIGDLEFKQNAKLPPEQQAITAFPDVTITDLQRDDEFLILACDGIWDVLSNDSAVSFVRERLARAGGEDLALICEEMCDKCLAPTATGVGGDNMTVMIVQFLDPLRERGVSPPS
eukprot:TRINITY_DN49977_c0_g1_i1.p1 TRINITY_DN49977_c0_g1~~TRINITY_DN49977_c0_g1_i1.p1  ORF type:complete len:301 (+),score=77.80 TRINITY_DN49977_c0_g1_i1:133-1035(+)